MTQATGHPLGLAVPHVRRAHRPVGPLRVHGRPEGLHHVRQEPVQAAADGGEQPLARGGLPGDEEAGQWQGSVVEKLGSGKGVLWKISTKTRKYINIQINIQNFHSGNYVR